MTVIVPVANEQVGWIIIVDGFAGSRHVAKMTLSKVISPSIVRARPSSVTPAPRAIAPESTRKFPFIDVAAPNPTAASTFQNTFCTCAPLIKIILTAAPTLKAPEILKINCAFGSPLASNVKSIESVTADATK